MFFVAGYWYLSLSGHIVVGDVGYDRLDLEMECCDLVTMENRNNHGFMGLVDIYLDLVGFFYGTCIGNIYHTWMRHGQEHVF